MTGAHQFQAGSSSNRVLEACIPCADNHNSIELQDNASTAWVCAHGNILQCFMPQVMYQFDTDMSLKQPMFFHAWHHHRFSQCM